MPGFTDFIFGRSNESQTGSVMQGTPPQQPQQKQVQTSQQQLQPQNNNQQPNPAGGTGAPGSGSGADNNADPTKGQGSPLDTFKDIFTIKQNVDANGNPVQVVDPLSQPLVNPDPEQMKAAVAKMNFAGSVTPELAQKALQGDVQSLMQMLNSVGQNAFLAAMSAQGPIINSAFRTNNERFSAALPDHVRNVQIKQAVPENPVLKHAAAAPILEAVKAQVAATNPSLSPTEVARHAENYFNVLAQDMVNNDPSRPKPSTALPANQDWSSFFK